MECAQPSAVRRHPERASKVTRPRSRKACDHPPSAISSTGRRRSAHWRRCRRRVRRVGSSPGGTGGKACAPPTQRSPTPALLAAEREVGVLAPVSGVGLVESADPGEDLGTARERQRPEEGERIGSARSVCRRVRVDVDDLAIVRIGSSGVRVWDDRRRGGQPFRLLLREVGDRPEEEPTGRSAVAPGRARSTVPAASS